MTSAALDIPAPPRPADARAAARRAAPLLGDDIVAALLVRYQHASERDVERCFEEAAAEGVFLEERVLAAGLVSAPILRRLLEDHFFCPAIDLDATTLDPAIIAMVPAALALRHLVLPIALEGDAIRVVMAHPDRTRLRDVVARAAGRRVLPAVALRHELWAAIERAHGRPPEPSAGSGLVSDSPPSRPSEPAMRPRRVEPAPAFSASVDATGIVDGLLEQALQAGATDIHIEPAETTLGVRFRIDGILIHGPRMPQPLAGPVASRLKVLAGMDIAERRAPQDGRASFRVGTETIDVRASTLPSRHGEKIVLRLLRRDSVLLRPDGLNLPPDIAARHREMIDAPMGLFIVTGPTGSGKTTTLYATLSAIDRSTLSVVTLEDPIEYELQGVTQAQIHDVAGLSFASGLRSILRQDPDVILVGEIREAETAEIACKAALTGHKVLSSLHANDSCQAVTRLTDMGLARDLIAATLKGVIAQRLLRRPCAQCRRLRPSTDLERSLLGIHAPEQLMSGAGCSACGSTGYKGRFAVFEYFSVSQPLQRLVLERASAGALKAAACRAGMRTMLEAGRAAVLAGDTTVEELQRVLLSEDGAEVACTRCGRGVAPEFTSCPFCMHALHEACRSCGAAVEDGWLACASCGTPRADRREAPRCARCAASLEAKWTKCPYCLHDVS